MVRAYGSPPFDAVQLQAGRRYVVPTAGELDNRLSDPGLHAISFGPVCSGGATADTYLVGLRVTLSLSPEIK